MEEYKASIEYNPDTLRRLNKVVTNTFQLKLKVFYLAVCIGLMVAGASVGLQNPSGIALIAIGCFLLPSVRVLERIRAEQAIRSMNGQVLKVEYLFHKNQFICSSDTEQNIFEYSSILRLVEEKDYLYLFPNAKQAYMIDVASICPADKEKFRSFLSRKVGLEWTRPFTLLTLNLRKLQFNRKNTRKPQQCGF